ncbi:hypothetical protein AX766_02875 [Flavobacterium covae]|nr:hypothetical protein AWN65_09975 [Flavobacterium covae]AND63440.1 hypothetical protein AX766_02875 [Flavobacterium covae]
MGCYKLTYNPLQIVRRHEPKPSREAKVVQCWMSIDPLAEEFPDTSPYAFCENNPLRFTDPTGMSSEDVIDPPGKKKQNQQTFYYFKEIRSSKSTRRLCRSRIR